MGDRSVSHPYHWFCTCEEPDFDGVECRKCYRKPEAEMRHTRGAQRHETKNGGQ